MKTNKVSPADCEDVDFTLAYGEGKITRDGLKIFAAYAAFRDANRKQTADRQYLTEAVMEAAKKS
jgi:hypothetical protein